jgi:hypothetical protein
VLTNGAAIAPTAPDAETRSVSVPAPPDNESPAVSV